MVMHPAAAAACKQLDAGRGRRSGHIVHQRLFHTPALFHIENRRPVGRGW
jgi:hypothetical protein